MFLLSPIYTYYWEKLTELWQYRATVSAFIGAIIAYMGGDVLLWRMCFIALMLDMSLGALRAIRLHQWDWYVFRRGIAKPAAYCVYLGLIWMLDISFSRAFGTKVFILDIFLAHLVFSDVISILRNLEDLDIPVPPMLRYVANAGRMKIQIAVENKVNSLGGVVSSRPAEASSEGTGAEHDSSEEVPKLKRKNVDEEID